MRYRSVRVQKVASARECITEERIVDVFAGAADVGYASSPTTPSEALDPRIPATSLGGVHQRETRGAIRGSTLLVEVDGHIGNQGFPKILEIHTRVVERPRSSVDDMATDAARLAWDVGHLAPVDHVVLGDAPLPAFRENRAWIDACGRQAGVSSGGDPVTGKAGWVR